MLDHKRVPDQPFWDLEIKEWGKHPKQEQIIKKGDSPSGIGYWAILDARDEATGDGDVARKAVAALTAQARREKPFFLAVGFRRPHSPYAAPARYFEHYSQERITLPEAPKERGEDVPPAASNGYP